MNVFSPLSKEHFYKLVEVKSLVLVQVMFIYHGLEIFVRYTLAYLFERDSQIIPVYLSVTILVKYLEDLD